MAKATSVKVLALLSQKGLIPCRPAILDLLVVGGTVDLLKAARGAAAVVLNAVPSPRGAGEVSIVVEARRELDHTGCRCWPRRSVTARCWRMRWPPAWQSRSLNPILGPQRKSAG